MTILFKKPRCHLRYSGFIAWGCEWSKIKQLSSHSYGYTEKKRVKMPNGDIQIVSSQNRGIGEKTKMALEELIYLV